MTAVSLNPNLMGGIIPEYCVNNAQTSSTANSGNDPEGNRIIFAIGYGRDTGARANALTLSVENSTNKVNCLQIP